MPEMMRTKKFLQLLCLTLIGSLLPMRVAMAQSSLNGTSSHIFLPLVVSDNNSTVDTGGNGTTVERGISGFSRVAFTLQTGTYNSPASGVVFNQVINGGTSVNAMQLHFSNANLGRNSFIRLTSLRDGGQQRLDADSIGYWSNYSAVFNGNQVRFELVAGPGDTGIFANMDSYFWGNRANVLLAAQAEHSLEPDNVNSLCGTDDRVAFTDARVARLNGNCTAWLVSNGAVLTAGHCTDFDPDGAGSGLPDGILDWTTGDVIEFNVPASDSDGSINWAAPNDQFPIDINRVVWHFEGEGKGLGKDWSVFAALPNQRNQWPHIRQGFFRMTNDNPVTTDLIRITGYGLDSTPTGTSSSYNAQSQTLQTNTGLFQSETIRGNDIWLQYRVDSEGANSGSPIIWDKNGFTVGIHTNAGCGTSASTGNAGTSFEVDALETAIEDFPSVNTIYVDAGGRANPGDGSIFRPYRSFSGAVSAAPSGSLSLLSIVPGSYPGAVTINKPLILNAPVGPVTLGQ